MPDTLEAEIARWQAWDRLLETTPDTGFMQSSWWANFRASVGFEYFGVTLKDGDALVGGAMVTRLWCGKAKCCFYYVQDGPVLPVDASMAEQVFARILEVIDQHRCADDEAVSHLRVEPRWEHLPDFVRGFQIPTIGDNYTEPRDTLCVDLRLSEEQILAQMRPKGRYNVRVAQRHGVVITEDSSALGLEDFIRIYQRTSKRQSTETKPRSYFRTLHTMLAPRKQVEVFFAECKGRRIAAALVVYFGRRATYFFGGSLVLQRHVMAPYLLHFEIMRRAKSLGCEWYDFWGVAPQDEPDHPWQNISVFKRKFGGVEVRLVPTLDYVYDAAAYARYVDVEKGASSLETTSAETR